MSRKQLVSIDHNNLPAINFKLNPLASAPASPAAGTSYFDTVSGKPLFHNGTAFLDLSARANHTGTQLAATISDFNTAVRTNRLDQMAVPTNALSINNQNINGVNAINATTVFGYTFTATDTATSTLGVGDVNQFVIDTNGNVTTESDITQTGAANFTFGTGTISASNNRIQNLAAPVSANDAARLVDVQSAAAGIDSKPSVRVVATTNVVIATGGLLTIDGVTLVANDRVLLKGQTTASENGVYVAAAGAWSRAADADATGEITPGSFWFVEEGTTYGATQWRCGNTGTITLGSTAITIQQFGAASMYTASNGVQLVGSNFSGVVVANSGLSVGASGFAIVTQSLGGLTTDSTGIGVKLPANSGLALVASGLQLDVATSGGLQATALGAGIKLNTNSGLALAAGGASVVGNAAQGINVGASGVGITLGMAPGLTFDGAGLATLINANGGLESTGGGVGLGIKLDTNPGLQTLSTGTSIKLAGSSGLTLTASGLAVDSTVAVKKYAGTIGDGTSTSIAVTHSLGTKDVTISVRDAATDAAVDCDWTATSTTVTTLTFATAPASNALRVVVHG